MIDPSATEDGLHLLPTRRPRGPRNPAVPDHTDWRRRIAVARLRSSQAGQLLPEQRHSPSIRESRRDHGSFRPNAECRKSAFGPSPRSCFALSCQALWLHSQQQHEQSRPQDQPNPTGTRQSHPARQDRSSGTSRVRTAGRCVRSAVLDSTGPAPAVHRQRLVPTERPDALSREPFILSFPCLALLRAAVKQSTHLATAPVQSERPNRAPRSGRHGHSSFPQNDIDERLRCGQDDEHHGNNGRHNGVPSQRSTGRSGATAIGHPLDLTDAHSAHLAMTSKARTPERQSLHAA
jgi:hypothetical protein